MCVVFAVSAVLSVRCVLGVLSGVSALLYMVLCATCVGLCVEGVFTRSFGIKWYVGDCWSLRKVLES